MQLIQPHTHLDLLAPMTGVEVDRARVLMLEGTLKFRDGITSKVTEELCVSIVVPNNINCDWLKSY